MLQNKNQDYSQEFRQEQLLYLLYFYFYKSLKFWHHEHLQQLKTFPYVGRKLIVLQFLVHRNISYLQVHCAGQQLVFVTIETALTIDYNTTAPGGAITSLIHDKYSSLAPADTKSCYFTPSSHVFCPCQSDYYYIIVLYIVIFNH